MSNIYSMLCFVKHIVLGQDPTLSLKCKKEFMTDWNWCGSRYHLLSCLMRTNFRSSLKAD